MNIRTCRHIVSPVYGGANEWRGAVLVPGKDPPMSDSTYWTRFGGTVSRRSVLRGSAVGAAGLAGAALIGCGGGSK